MCLDIYLKTGRFLPVFNNLMYNNYMNARAKKGFTYIELIIVLFIATTIFSGILPLIFKTITANKAAKLKLIAYESAHQEIENIRGQDISTLSNHNFAVAGISGATGSFTIDKNIDGQERTDIAKVNSKISWTFKGKTENIEVNTYLYGGGQ